MSKWEKTVARLMTVDASMRFEELERILLHLGYEERETHGGSSHVTFRKDGKNPITIPRHHPLNKVYINLVKKVFEEENR